MKVLFLERIKNGREIYRMYEVVEGEVLTTFVSAREKQMILSRGSAILFEDEWQADCFSEVFGCEDIKDYLLKIYNHTYRKNFEDKFSKYEGRLC